MELDLHLRMRFSFNVEARAMADEGYIRGLAAKLQGRIEDEKHKTVKDNREAEIIKAESPKYWMELKAWLRDTADKLEPIHYEEESVNEAHLRCLAGRGSQEITVNFWPMTGDIYTKGNSSGRTAFCAVVDGNRIYYVDDLAPNARVDIEKMGQKILNTVVG